MDKYKSSYIAPILLHAYLYTYQLFNLIYRVVIHYDIVQCMLQFHKQPAMNTQWPFLDQSKSNQVHTYGTFSSSWKWPEKAKIKHNKFNVEHAQFRDTFFSIFGIYFTAPPKKMPKSHLIIEHTLIFL